MSTVNKDTTKQLIQIAHGCMGQTESVVHSNIIRLNHAKRHENHQRILAIIALISSNKLVDDGTLNEHDSAYTIVTEVFTKGNCANFALMLHLAIGDGIIGETRDHCVYGLDDRWYDITGDVTSVFKDHPGMIRYEYAEAVEKLDLNRYSFDARGPLF